MCTSATAAAAAAAVGTGAQADAFNAVFGITTDFAAVAEVSDQGVTVAAGAATTAAAATTTVSTVDAMLSLGFSHDFKASSATSSAVSSSAASSAAAATATAAANGANLQTFTGALGGVEAPAVTASGSQFQVAGNDLFNDVAAAVERSW